jgi:hypothetical protein
MMNKRKIIVNLATSADGYIARPDGDIEWLTKRPAPRRRYTAYGPRHRDVPLHLDSVQQFPNGGVQLHYKDNYLACYTAWWGEFIDWLLK